MNSEKVRLDCTTSFYRVFSESIPPLRADKSALGTLPTAAFQYCEPVRTASQYGWYIFPPKDVSLTWDGTDVYHGVENDWVPLTRTHIDEEFPDYWDQHAPDDLKGCAPPFLTSLFVPGVVQVWSGLLIGTSDGWSSHIGPVANFPQARRHSCYEGIIESDRFRPCPLFINIRLLVTGQEIVLPKTKPLFQVKPILRDCYAAHALQQEEFVGLEPRDGDAIGMSVMDWEGFRSTIRRDADIEDYSPGSYAAAGRKRAKREDRS